MDVGFFHSNGSLRQVDTFKGKNHILNNPFLERDAPTLPNGDYFIYVYHLGSQATRRESEWLLFKKMQQDLPCGAVQAGSANPDLGNGVVAIAVPDVQDSSKTSAPSTSG